MRSSDSTAPVVAADVAAMYAWMGRPDRASETMEPWLDQPMGDSLVRGPSYGDLLLNPIWDPVRDHRRFSALATRLTPGRKLPPSIENR